MYFVFYPLFFFPIISSPFIPPFFFLVPLVPIPAVIRRIVFALTSYIIDSRLFCRGNVSAPPTSVEMNMSSQKTRTGIANDERRVHAV